MPGHFAQTHAHPELIGRTLLDILWREHAKDRGAAMSRLRRYELTGQAEQRFEKLSGGQQARFQILLLELEGATALLTARGHQVLANDIEPQLERAIRDWRVGVSTRIAAAVEDATPSESGIDSQTTADVLFVVAYFAILNQALAVAFATLLIATASSFFSTRVDSPRTHGSSASGSPARAIATSPTSCASSPASPGAAPCGCTCWVTTTPGLPLGRVRAVKVGYRTEREPPCVRIADFALRPIVESSFAPISCGFSQERFRSTDRPLSYDPLASRAVGLVGQAPEGDRGHDEHS